MQAHLPRPDPEGPLPRGVLPHLGAAYASPLRGTILITPLSSRPSLMPAHLAGVWAAVGPCQAGGGCPCGQAFVLQVDEQCEPMASMGR